jgi:hypothetical protein
MVAARGVLVGLVRAMPSSAMAWVLLQRFVRRADGAAAARDLFQRTHRSRMSGELGHHVYLAHALLEWCAKGGGMNCRQS